MHDERAHELAADARPPVLGQHTRRDERTLAEARGRRDPAARQDAVALREQEQAPRLVGRDELLRGHRLVRHDPALHVGPANQVPGRGRDAQLDHPDRFSFPCCFA